MASDQSGAPAQTSSLTLPASRVPDPRDAPALRWGIVATGGIAAQFADTVARGTASRVVAISSRSREKAERFAGEHAPGAVAHAGVAEMLAAGGLDAVYVASPHAQHADDARPVLEAGVPVLVEKALTLNEAQARGLVDLARERGVFLMEAMWMRFLPQSDVLRQVIDQGLLGEVVSVRADHGQRFPMDPRHRLYAPELGGGALLDLGVYPISLAQMLLGDLTDLAIRGDLTSTGVDASASLLARGARGAQAVLATTLSARLSNDATVAGTEGTAHLSAPFYGPGTLEVELADGRSAAFTHPGDEDLGMAYEAAEVARCLAAGRTESPLMPWADSLAVMRTMDAVRAELGVLYPAERDGQASA